ncbi:hypothetical protein F511_43058 [Dorcoceras hygrometricum]|uniref:Uncharacterized protein n=1 Tax=Dorcoceras hygrometricum TaxID=472368 RepID=A0A2Z7A276_9LAMI|nr:hypothetical protein F511_43058 [Dorcoceras hygrometricum]
MVVGSLATLDLPMVVDPIGIYMLKGPYYTLTMTDWFLQALSVIPRGSWIDVSRRFTMIRCASPKMWFRSHTCCGLTDSYWSDLIVDQDYDEATARATKDITLASQTLKVAASLPPQLLGRRPSPRAAAVAVCRRLRGWTCSDPLTEEIPSVINSSRILVQTDEGAVFPVMDQIRRTQPPLKCQVPCQTGRIQASRRHKLAVGPQQLRLRNHNFGLTHRTMVKRLAKSPHDPLGITDSACKNQSVMVSVQYGPFNTYIPIRSTTIAVEATVHPVATQKHPVARRFRRSFWTTRRKQQQHPVERLFESAIAIYSVASYSVQSQDFKAQRIEAAKISSRLESAGAKQLTIYEELRELDVNC